MIFRARRRCVSSDRDIAFVQFAEPFARRSVEIRERTVGPDHLLTALDRAALAPILDALGLRDEAEALLASALPQIERCMPDWKKVTETSHKK